MDRGDPYPAEMGATVNLVMQVPAVQTGSSDVFNVKSVYCVVIILLCHVCVYIE